MRENAVTPANKRGNRVNITPPGETMRVLRSALLALALLPLVAVAQQSPTGRWKTIDDETGKVKTIVAITQAADGTLQGKGVEILPPDRGPHHPCDKCKGANQDIE